MASTVYVEETITLQSGKDVTLRPLTISRLRRFMKAFGQLSELADGEDGFDVFIECCGICLEHEFKGDFESLKSSAKEQEEGIFLSEEYREYLGESLDLDTVYKILDVCGGIKLNDPNLQEALLAAANQE